MPRMAAANAFDGHPAAGDDAVLSQRLHAVIRATGIEAATRAEEGTHGELIGLNQRNHGGGNHGVGVGGVILI